MGRKPQITKEQILQNGLEMINEQGWGNVNITTLANRLECSTQPIVWHFGNMENFRAELLKFALAYVQQRIPQETPSPVCSFLQMGRAYVELSYKKPKLANFLLSEKAFWNSENSFGFVFDDTKNTPLSFAFSNALGVDVSTAKEFMKSVAVYTFGLVQTLSSESVEIDLDTAVKMYESFGVRFLTSCGLSRAKARGIYSL